MLTNKYNCYIISSVRTKHNAERQKKGLTIMKYYVIATKWDDEKKAAIEYIAGEFTEYSMANLFKNAYNEKYKTDAKVVA